MRHFRKYVDSKFYYSVFPSNVIGHIFACVCEVQLRFFVDIYEITSLADCCLTIFCRPSFQSMEFASGLSVKVKLAMSKVY